MFTHSNLGVSSNLIGYYLGVAERHLACLTLLWIEMSEAMES